MWWQRSTLSLEYLETVTDNNQRRGYKCFQVTCEARHRSVNWKLIDHGESRHQVWDAPSSWKCLHNTPASSLPFCRPRPVRILLGTERALEVVFRAHLLTVVPILSLKRNL